MKQRFRKKIKSVVFDSKERKEYLTGFHQRKLLRRQKAIKDFEAKIREEKKQDKKIIKENMNEINSFKSNKAEIKNVYEEKYDLTNDYPEQLVTVTTFSDFDLSNSNTLLGPNNMTISNEPDANTRNKKEGFEKVESSALNGIDKMEKTLQKLRSVKKRKKSKRKKGAIKKKK